MPSRLKSVLPGLAVLLLITLLAWLATRLIAGLPAPLHRLPVSMMLLAILAGLALNGVAARRARWQPGLALARGLLLKTAVALIGLRLALGDLGTLGWQALPLVLGTIVVGLGLCLLLGRLLRVPQRLGLLLAAGTAICGASAIAALAPAIRASSQEVCYAVACVALFGLVATLAYPPLLQSLLANPELVGFALGAAIHDTAQVTAAAVFHQQLFAGSATLDAATVTKLLRNLGMLVVIPLLAWLYSRRDDATVATPAFPLFILAFIGLSVVRTIGDAVFGADAAAWQWTIRAAGLLSLTGFSMAMAALAMAIQPAQLRGLGWTPALVALLAAAGMLGWVMIWL